jgi:hypothetical protein
LGHDLRGGACAAHLAEHDNDATRKCCAVASGVLLVLDELGQYEGGAPLHALSDAAADAREALQSLVKRLDEYLPLAQRSHERAQSHPGLYRHDCGEVCERPRRIRQALPGLLDDLRDLRSFVPSWFTALDLSQPPSEKPRPLLRWNVAMNLKQAGYSATELAWLIGWNPDDDGIEARVSKLLARYS